MHGYATKVRLCVTRELTCDSGATVTTYPVPNAPRGLARAANSADKMTSKGRFLLRGVDV